MDQRCNFDQQKESEPTPNLQFKGNPISLVIFICIITLVFCYLNTLDSPHSKARQNQLLYWLANIDLDQVQKSPFKYVIIDYSADGSEAKEFSREKIENLRNSLPEKRVVLSYLSIGEAEDYRFYWNKSWKPAPSPPHWQGNPSFLGPENQRWKGNYIVDYRDPQWRKIIYSYLDRIMDRGFDGIYMDRIDSYITLQQAPYNIKNARDEMEKFVKDISRYTRSKRPGFKIFVQNAEELARNPDGSINREYLDAIEGIGKESTFYYATHRRSESNIQETVKHLQIFEDNGKMVFTIDYPNMYHSNEVKWIYSQARRFGFIEYCGTPELNKMIIQP